MLAATGITAPWVSMRPYLLKLLKNGVPTAVVLAVVGYLFAQLAAMWYVSESGGRANVGVQEMSETLQWRLPLTMAAWGFGLVALFEGVLSLWRTPAPTPSLTAAPPAVDETEQLLLQLLEEAEAAEAVRQSRIPLTQTPLPGHVAAVRSEPLRASR